MEAVLSGRNALGADSNPLAEAITKVKTNYIPRKELEETLSVLLKQAKQATVNRQYPDAITAWFAPSSIFFTKKTKRAESANGIMKNVEIID